ncbi:MAG: hypothetical protein PVG91_00285 [Gammaproteobacteria bacterium]
MGIFSRKQKTKIEADSGSDRRVEGIVRRGLAGTDGDLPLAKIEIDPEAEGRSFNPYDSTDADDTVGPRKKALREAEEEQRNWRDSGFNPYDTHSNLPKMRSWEDVPFDSVEKDRKKR